MTSSTVRAAGFFGFWLILTGLSPADIPVGMLAAVLAARASGHLLPSGQWTLQPFALARLVLRFLRQSVAAGLDVAMRAFDPRLPLRLGFIDYRPRTQPGPVRSVFCTITSLLPGTLPCGPDKGDRIAVHCLDVSQPVAEQLATEEAFLLQALGDERSRG
jgi:multicomponent Na+:H+ antiporter subunit E